MRLISRFSLLLVLQSAGRPTNDPSCSRPPYIRARSGPLVFLPPPHPFYLCATAGLQASGDLTKLRLWEQMQVLGAASRERGSYLAIFKVMGAPSSDVKWMLNPLAAHVCCDSAPKVLLSLCRKLRACLFDSPKVLLFSDRKHPAFFSAHGLCATTLRCRRVKTTLAAREEAFHACQFCWNIVRRVVPECPRCYFPLP